MLIIPLTRPLITGCVIPAASGVTLLARLVGQLLPAEPITRASLVSIAYTVTDLTTGLPLGIGIFPVASTVYDQLQQGDPAWTIDTPARPGVDQLSGYNFAGQLPATLFPVSTPAPPSPLTGQPAKHRIQCDVAFTPTAGGQPFRVSFVWDQGAVYG